MTIELKRVSTEEISEALHWVQASEPGQPVDYTHRVLAAEVLALNADCEQREEQLELLLDAVERLGVPDEALIKAIRASLGPKP
jgi:hypothetical protein